MSDETPDQVTLDDLPAIDWANQEINELLVICPRCTGAVFRTSSAMRDHERWHAAIEDAADPRLSTLRRAELDRLVKTVTADPVSYFRNLGFSVADAEQAGAAASAQPGEFQPLRDQLIARFEEIDDGDNVTTAAWWIDKIMPLIEAWAEKYLSRATVAEQRIASAELELAAQRSALAEREKQDQIPDHVTALAMALEMSVNTPYAYLVDKVYGLRYDTANCNLQHAGLSRGETDRLRRLEQAMMDLGAPGNTDAAIAWLQTREIQVPSLPHEWSTQDMANAMVGQQMALDRLRDVVRAAGCPADANVIDWIEKQLTELDWRRKAALNEDRYGAHHEPVSPSVAGIIDAQNVELLRLAARGRLAYADREPVDVGPLSKTAKHLRHEAHIFESAAQVIENPRILAKLIPTSMQTWSLDDDVAEIVAKATGIRVVLLNPTLDTAADPQRNAEVLTDQMLTDMLCLVGVTPTPAQLTTWTPEQREQAANWAGAVHLDASDNDVDVPERPAFLDEYPSEVCTSLYYRELDRTLYACNRPADQHKQSGSGPAGDVWHGWRAPDTSTEQGDHVPWTTEMAVPVPWPLDQEPPAGIDVLRAVDTPREEDEPTFTLRRHRGGWVWQEGVEPIQALHGDTWTQVTQHCGELHVVRP